MEGERDKKSSELLLKAVNHMPKMEALGQFITCKGWDKLEECDAPELVAFCATPDILSGLFTVAHFEEAESLLITSSGNKVRNRISSV
jgi:hypothetical protein